MKRENNYGTGHWVSCLAAMLLTTTFGTAQIGITTTNNTNGPVDPGPRGGPAGAGGYYPTLNTAEQALFSEALDAFNEVNSVKGTIAGEESKGLGPTFNGNSCAMCHAQPDVGGSSPSPRSPQRPMPNPQVALARLHGADNTVPSFITAAGPVREARFIAVSNQNRAALDGGVHGLYTIKGRPDAVGCNLAQTDFATQLANHNVIFRIPTPVFGLGLVENTTDAALQANLSANTSQKSQMGISGQLNTSGNDGTVTKFGWKAQNKSLLIFSGEAYNVEQGVTSELFPTERSAVAGCVFNATPEDATGLESDSSDAVNFAVFMRLTAPPRPATSGPSQLNGRALFESTGCALCHTPSLTTTKAIFTGMSNVTYHPFSDFAVHGMGSNLADGINQGNAGPDEFRTAPLWGVGQRLFFLHDGRTSDLLEAIRQHASPGRDCVSMQSSQQFEANNDFFNPSSQSFTCGSEANGVIQKFNNLSRSDQQDILNFLRSL